MRREGGRDPAPQRRTARCLRGDRSPSIPSGADDRGADDGRLGERGLERRRAPRGGPQPPSRDPRARLRAERGAPRRGAPAHASASADDRGRARRLQPRARVALGARLVALHRGDGTRRGRAGGARAAAGARRRPRRDAGTDRGERDGEPRLRQLWPGSRPCAHLGGQRAPPARLPERGAPAACRRVQPRVRRAGRRHRDRRAREPLPRDRLRAALRAGRDRRRGDGRSRDRQPVPRQQPPRGERGRAARAPRLRP